VEAHLPVIVVEVVLVFGGVLLFAVWQFRDLARERRRRQHGQRDAAQPPAGAQPQHPAGDAGAAAPAGSCGQQQPPSR
jgi:hypothetical protein